MRGFSRWANGLVVFTVLALLGWLGWSHWLRQAALSLKQPMAASELEAAFLERRFPEGAIRTGPADNSAVCHDWAFGMAGTSGPLDPQEIESLLLRYEYTAVSRPALGDLVIYRDAHGNIHHSALVRALGDAKMVLVESKWGTLGRFLHRVELPEFGLAPEYYRRSRDVGPSMAAE